MKKYATRMPVLLDEPVRDEITGRRPSLAPWQHTLFLIMVLGLWAAYGGLRSRVSPSAMPLTVRYISSIVMQSLLVGSTLAGIYHRRSFLTAVIGRPNVQRFLKDFIWGILIFFAGLVVLFVVRFAIRLTPLHGTYRIEVVRGMLPQSSLELALWIVVGLAAGIGEEFVFRGYFLTQLRSWLRNVPAAIVVCAILFGCMHFYQGAEGVIGTAALGALYGVCAWRMGNLRCVMIAHSLEDITVGLIHYFRHA